MDSSRIKQELTENMVRFIEEYRKQNRISTSWKEPLLGFAEGSTLLSPICPSARTCHLRKNAACTKNLEDAAFAQNTVPPTLWCREGLLISIGAMNT